MRWPRQICFQKWLHVWCCPYVNETMALRPWIQRNLHIIWWGGDLDSVIPGMGQRDGGDTMWLTVKDMVAHSNTTTYFQHNLTPNFQTLALSLKVDSLPFTFSFAQVSNKSFMQYVLCKATISKWSLLTNSLHVMTHYGCWTVIDIMFG